MHNYKYYVFTYNKKFNQMGQYIRDKYSRNGDLYFICLADISFRIKKCAYLGDKFDILHIDFIKFIDRFDYRIEMIFDIDKENQKNNYNESNINYDNSYLSSLVIYEWDISPVVAFPFAEYSVCSKV